MPANNARKHTIPTAAEQSIGRLTIFEEFGLSIHDIVPVASITERTQFVAAMTAKSRPPSVTNPLVVHRADAPGVSRIEYTVNGTVWLPASGLLEFASKAAADSFGTANGGLLTTGDRCRVGSVIYVWQGAWRQASFTMTTRVANPTITSASPITVITMNLPADAPAGTYEVKYMLISDGGTQTRFHQVQWAGAELTNWSNDSVPNCSGGHQAADTLIKTGHAGGAAELKLIHQNNGTSPSCRAARLTATYIGP